MTGQLIAIARRAKSRVPMEELSRGVITQEAGLEGDFRGAKFPTRQITVLAREDWEAALSELGDLMGQPCLPWTTRRANLLVAGIRLPCARGAILTIGPVALEVTGQTNPCHRMESAHKGLLSALHPHWRGGVTCRVLQGGPIELGDTVAIAHAPAERPAPRLPG